MPKISLFYGPPKVGKSTWLSQLPKCLTLDTEEGHHALTSMYVDIYSAHGFDEAVNKVVEAGMKLNPAGTTPDKIRYPYDFIAVDTVDKLEDYCEDSATRNYKKSTKGKDFGGTTVLELDYGLGYYFLREEVMNRIMKLALCCRHLILICHIKAKELDKGGVTVSVNDLSLTGKLSSLVAGKCDSIGYVYRDEKNASKLMVSFLAPSDKIAMGARFPYLAGKRMEAKWENIFPEYFGLPIPQ